MFSSRYFSYVHNRTNWRISPLYNIISINIEHSEPYKRLLFTNYISIEFRVKNLIVPYSYCVVDNRVNTLFVPEYNCLYFSSCSSTAHQFPMWSTILYGTAEYAVVCSYLSTTALLVFLDTLFLIVLATPTLILFSVHQRSFPVDRHSFCRKLRWKKFCPFPSLIRSSGGGTPSDGSRLFIKTFLRAQILRPTFIKIITVCCRIDWHIDRRRVTFFRHFTVRPSDARHQHFQQRNKRLIPDGRHVSADRYNGHLSLFDIHTRIASRRSVGSEHVWRYQMGKIYKVK